MNLLEKMNNLNLLSKSQTPSLIELPTPVINKANNKTQVTTVSVQKKQTPAEIVSEVSKPLEVLIQCQFNIRDESRQYLENPISRQISLNPEELEELLVFASEIEQKRRKQEKDQQEKRSWVIAKKINNCKNGKEFLNEHSIACNAENNEWSQNLLIVKDENNQEEIGQALNFYMPQHSWILESWLSQQASSWTVRRYCPNEQIIYQVSFGFPDQTFLEAEGPSREGAILAIAEDLLED